MTVTTIDTHAVCVVCLTELLVPLLAQQQHAREGTHRTDHLAGVLTTLAEEAAISPRRLYGILQHEYATVGLTIVDELLSVALGRPDLIQSLEVFRRPRGRRMGIAGNHVCSRAPDFSSARRLAAVEPPPTTSAPAAEAFAASTRGGEADAPAAEGRAAA